MRPLVEINEVGRGFNNHVKSSADSEIRMFDGIRILVPPQLFFQYKMNLGCVDGKIPRMASISLCFFLKNWSVVPKLDWMLFF